MEDLRRRDFGGDFGGQKLRDNADYRAANGRAQAVVSGLLSGLSPAAKPRQASDRPHLRLAGAGVAFRNCTTSRDRNAGDQWIGIQCIGINTYPLE